MSGLVDEKFINMFNILDGSQWQKIDRTDNGLISDYSVSYQNLLPSTLYLFRVIAYNEYGISWPVYSKETVGPWENK